MSQAYYDIYITKVKNLAKTMVIKSAASALAVNTAVATDFGLTVDESDPTTWKYYMSMAGEYHATDLPMTVLSLDTQQTIEFSTQNLQIHLATAQAYVFGSQYYIDLLARYPTQDQLILGIINPLDINAAIAAEDNQILWYDSSLVEENETNLIPQIQDWINGYMFRWNVANYSIADDLYVAAQLAYMYLFLPLTILNIRLDNCHTRFANSYHVQEYLASNSMLDAYVPYLTTGQKLWLYRNIRYLQRNPGSSDTFAWLTDNIMTPQGLPLAAWSMQHNLSTMPDDLYPKIEYTRAPLNLGYNRAGVNVQSTAGLLQEESGLARENSAVQADATTEIDTQMQLSRYDRLGTKVLESNVIDTSDSSLFTLSDMLLNHWLYLAAKGLYLTFITVTDPATTDKYTLSAADAWVFYYYAFQAQYGFAPDVIPTFTALLVRRIPLPDLSELQAMVDPLQVTTATLQQGLSLNPPITTMIAVEAFNNLIVAQHNAILNQRMLYSILPTYTSRSMGEAAMLRMYQDVSCDINAGQSYADWFAERNIDISSMTETQFGDLAKELVTTATGADLNSGNTLANIQAAMLGIMRQLSSYSVQFVRIINTSTLHVADWAAPRLGDMHGKYDFTARVLSAPLWVTAGHARTHFKLDMDPTADGLTYDTHIAPRYSMPLDINLDIDHAHKTTFYERVPLSRLIFTRILPDVVDISNTVPSGAIDVYDYITLTPVSDGMLYYNDPSTYGP